MIDATDQGFGCYVIHFSPLRERRSFLEKALTGIRTEWVTEWDVIVESYPWRNSNRVFGVSRRTIASDLGINARSLTRSRRQATYESYFYRYASLFGERFKKVTFGSLPNDARLPRNILELNVMHIHSVLLFIQDNKEWGLFLEDDSVFSEEGLGQVSVISREKKLKPTWINLNDGAGLTRTSSEKRVNEAGLFRVKPPATRCASAYVINREYALRLKDLIMVHGIPDWLPIDVLYQIANRKMHAESYWSEPIRFIQGSSSGIYKSSLESIRIRE